jgi:hypothetical protein
LSRLILAYPGTGSRELAKLIYGVHLDKIGYFKDSNDYWSWMIDISKFMELWGKPHTFVGYGLNWKELIDIAGVDRVSVYKIPLNQYLNNVIRFRKSVQYQKVDLTMILKTKDHDYPIFEYGRWYMEFVAACEAYIAKLVEGIIHGN